MKIDGVDYRKDGEWFQYCTVSREWVGVHGDGTETLLDVIAAQREALADIVRRIEEWESAVRAVVRVEPSHGMDLTAARAALALTGDGG